jgi:hypothetical protein
MRFVTERGAPSSEQVRVGLCARCQFMRKICSPRGSTFYFCAKSKVAPNFPKYPRLPVLACSGYAPEDAPLPG